MKIGIVGNRKNWTHDEVSDKLLELNIFHSDILISGGAEGVDTFAQIFAKHIGCEIQIIYPKKHYPALGENNRFFRRNKEIALRCDILLAFDKKKGGSGTKNTIKYAKENNKQVIIITDIKQKLNILH